jgi:hypothetical protein
MLLTAVCLLVVLAESLPQLAQLPAQLTKAQLRVLSCSRRQSIARHCNNRERKEMLEEYMYVIYSKI